MEMLLKNKTAVIYGAGGAVGRTVAHTFAREGARLFLTGRTIDSIEQVAKVIRATGGAVEAAQVDALDEHAIEAHVDEVVRKAGSIDVSFNLVGMGDVQGAPLIEMSLEDFVRPIIVGTKTQFLTTSVAARRMVNQGAGVILIITATPARLPIPAVGGFGVAGAALEGLSRQLAAEVAPSGVRVICLRSAGSPEAPGVDKVLNQDAQAAGMTRKDLQAQLEQGMFLRRFPNLAEVANVAALMASDLASPMTGTVANMTCGAIAD
jgi:3-oxoacyl-[acyl-carrier protein] reductase